MQSEIEFTIKPVPNVVRRCFDPNIRGLPFEEEAMVFGTEVVVCVIKKWLNIAVNDSKEHGNTRITPKHLQVIKKDEELDMLLRRVIGGYGNIEDYRGNNKIITAHIEYHENKVPQ